MDKTRSKNLITDRDEALAAVIEDGRVLKNASEEFRADSEVVLAAVSSASEYGDLMQYVSNSPLQIASEDLRADREIVLAAVKQSGFAFWYASESLQNDLELTSLYEEFIASTGIRS